MTSHLERVSSRLRLFGPLVLLAACVPQPEAPEPGPIAPPGGTPILTIVSQDHCTGRQSSPDDPFSMVVDVLVRNVGDVDYGGGGQVSLTIANESNVEAVPAITAGDVAVVAVELPSPPGGDYTVEARLNNQPPVLSSCIG